MGCHNVLNYALAAAQPTRVARKPDQCHRFGIWQPKNAATMLPQRQSGTPTALQRAAEAVDHGIAAGTAKVATWVSTKPWTTIALALFISALCTRGFMNIKSEDQPDKLFVPDNSRAFRDRRWVESRFPNDASVSTMILDHKNGRNLLDKEALLEVFDVYDRVLATSSDGGNRGYDQRSCAVNTRNPAQPCFDAASCYRVDGAASIASRCDGVRPVGSSNSS